MGYLLYACYKQQRQQLAGIDYVFSGLEFVPFSKRADSRYDGQAWAYYGCLNLFANTKTKKRKKNCRKGRKRSSEQRHVHNRALSFTCSLFREIIIFHQPRDKKNLKTKYGRRQRVDRARTKVDELPQDGEPSLIIWTFAELARDRHEPNCSPPQNAGE